MGGGGGWWGVLRGVVGEAMILEGPGYLVSRFLMELQIPQLGLSAEAPVYNLAATSPELSNTIRKLHQQGNYTNTRA